MSSKETFSNRADELADVLRRYLVGINTGGIAASLTFAASLAEKGINPNWVFWPVAIFVVGLGVSGGSMLYAKHKALKRRDAADNGGDIPEFDSCLQRNFSWDLVTLLIFLAGCTCGLIELNQLSL